MLPAEAAASLDNDPEQLDILCLELLSYASVKAAFDQAGNDDKAIEHMKDHPHMLAVRRNTLDLHQERVAEQRRKFSERAAQAPTPGRRELQKREQDAKPRAPRPRTRTRAQYHG